MSEGEVHYGTRINRINRCIALLADHSDQIAKAIDEDYGGRSPRFNKMGEIIASLGSLKHVRKHLKKWMRPERRSVMFPIGLLGARARLHHQPKGVCGIIAPWNFPIHMVFAPLADILGAGNRAMIKPSEHTPKTSMLLAELFDRYFEETEISVCNGGPELGAEFSKLAFDHLIFTGSNKVGRIVLEAAAKNMVPVTLELGGKSPVIVSTSAKIADVAEKVIIGKCFNSGQACISPDYIFLPEGKVEGFVRVCRNVFAEMYPTVVNNRDMTSMIHRPHYKRIMALLEDARKAGTRIEEINPANESLNPASNRMPFYLLIKPNQETKIQQEEIFGPLLIVQTYTDIQDVIDYINQRPRPLALYYFGHNKKEQHRVLSCTRSGGVSINEVMLHAGCDDMPFGGIGESGMGHYHGIEGFKTFSHARSVFHQGFVNIAKIFGTLPPYGQKIDNLIKSQIKS